MGGLSASSSAVQSRQEENHVVVLHDALLLAAELPVNVVDQDQDPWAELLAFVFRFSFVAVG